MKKKIVLSSLVLCAFVINAWSQTSSFGGLIEPGTTAGTGGVNGAYFGHQAGENTTGIGNTFIGFQSGRANLNGIFNTATGFHTMLNNEDGSRNTAYGYRTLYTNITGGENTALGFQTLFSNIDGESNTAGGHLALFSNESGSFNTAYGNRALFINNGGERNTALGHEALRNNTFGNFNTASGASALFNNQLGEFNTAHGYQALYSNTNGDRNTATGFSALRSNTGQFNTANGMEALVGNTSGNGNTATGYRALENNMAGSFNTAIGYNAGPNANNLFNATAVGFGATNTASNQVRIGNAGVTSIEVAVLPAVFSDARFKSDIKEDIPGLDFITKLRPVSYQLERARIQTFFGQEASNLSPTQRTIGFVAQEVEALLEEGKYMPIGVEAPQNDQDHYSIRYAEFVVPLTKAIQEQQAMIEALTKEVQRLKSQVQIAKPESETAHSQHMAKGFALGQNVPNPFTLATTITAEIPEGVAQAKIVVYNLNGGEVDSYPLSKHGKNTIEIAAGTFPPGIYFYSLVVDGEVIGLKKLMLVE